MAKKQQTDRSPRARAERARKVANAKAEGKTGPEIAREAGCSLRTARRDLATVVDQVVVAFVGDHHERIGQLFAASLEAFSEALSANRSTTVSERQVDGSTVARVVDLGPDPYARLAAARGILALLTAGRSTSKPTEPSKEGISITWQQYEELYAAKQRDLAAEALAKAGHK